MKLYLVRHGAAATAGTAGATDEERPLTPKGVKRMKQAALGLLELGIAPEIILTSPLRRAQQTAEILHEVFDQAVLETLPALAPGCSHADLYRALVDRQHATAAILVGHQPALGEIASEIAWGSSACALDFRKGGVCALDLERVFPTPRGRLSWLATPKMLRRIA